VSLAALTASSAPVTNEAAPSSGRKFPFVFAGVMLGDDAMANINQSFPKAQFGEDEQTAYGDCWTRAKVVFTGHSGQPPYSKDTYIDNSKDSRIIAL
jgi:hypothetical protein